ncbi:MAG: putative transcriptional regulator, AsnC family [Firmicutes bacterium]|nr:putative transcriptional regulator, AsnC family [Bacillota bacterium]
MLTEFDKSLLNIIQSDLALSKQPFALIAERLGTDEATVIDRIRRLKDQGYIRRIGAFFDSARLGYTGTLLALEVEAEQIEKVVELINSYPGVTHNYEREGRFNLWITLLTSNVEEEKRIVSVIESLPGVNRLLNLPATEKFKVNVQFNLE